MGSQAIIDILGSMVIFGSFLLIMINLQMDNYEYSTEYTNQLIVQRNLVNLSQIIENDIRKVGYDPRPWIVRGRDRQSEDFSFNLIIADTNILGIKTPVSNRCLFYRLGDDDTTTVNPRDKVLVKGVISPDEMFNMDEKGEKIASVTKFQVRYFNDSTEIQQPIQDEDIYKISSAEIYIQIETPFPIDNYNAIGLGNYVIVDSDSSRKYCSAEWQYRFAVQKLTPKEM